jgi:hypothetical protein
MYGKRLLAALTAIFALFVLTGCGNEPIASVNEEDYYPRFEIKADNISHNAYVKYADVEECEYDVEAFKSKGPYDITDFSLRDTTTYGRNDPLGDGAIEKAELKRSFTSTLTSVITSIRCQNDMTLSVLDDNIARDNELFDKVFGYKKGELAEVYVVKYYSGDDAANYVETYINLLEKQGFKKKGSTYTLWGQTTYEQRTWTKKDSDTDIEYEWGYDIDENSKNVIASWDYHNFR